MATDLRFSAREKAEKGAPRTGTVLSAGLASSPTPRGGSWETTPGPSGAALSAQALHLPTHHGGRVPSRVPLAQNCPASRCPGGRTSSPVRSPQHGGLGSTPEPGWACSRGGAGRGAGPPAPAPPLYEGGTCAPSLSSVHGPGLKQRQSCKHWGVRVTKPGLP